MSDPIADAATRYIAALNDEREAKRKRASYHCYHQAPEQDEEGMPPHLHPDGEPWQSSPCWKMVMIEPRDRGKTYALEHLGDNSPRGWCTPCSRRQAVHDGIAALTRRRVGALASLRAAVRRHAAEGGSDV